MNTSPSVSGAWLSGDDVRARTGSKDLYAVLEVFVKSQSAIRTPVRSTESSRADEHVGTDKPSWIDTAMLQIHLSLIC